MTIGICNSKTRWPFFDVPTISDHSPVRVQLGGMKAPKRLPFRYEEVWSGDVQFLDIVKECWAAEVRGCAMFRLIHKLKQVKQSLKHLNTSCYSKLQERSKMALQHLEEVQQRLATCPLNSDLMQSERQACDNYMTVHSLYLKELKQ